MDNKSISNFIKGSISIFTGALTILKQNFKKHAANSTAEIPDNCRENLEADYEKCDGCGLCAKTCPSPGTLQIKDTEKDGKKLVAIDISRCAFCGNCTYICPKNALNMTKQYELATNDKKGLILDAKALLDEKTKPLDADKNETDNKTPETA